MSTIKPRTRRASSRPSAFPHDEPVGAIDYGAVEQVPLEQLKPFAGNPRVHDEEQVHTLARMIQATRIMAPVVADGDDRILAGEARLQAARLLGMKTVPVVRALDRSEAEMQLYRLADNRAVELVLIAAES